MFMQHKSQQLDLASPQIGSKEHMGQPYIPFYDQTQPKYLLCDAATSQECVAKAKLSLPLDPLSHDGNIIT